ncbi:MAG TPA: hypothetical protein PLJ35_16570 [Anaerolineae bacterium]|nr:hypothetical protein [Anaerolineae bacterium]HPL30321.1 hypothetical protein [Anaerolineae bacterium]
MNTSRAILAATMLVVTLVATIFLAQLAAPSSAQGNPAEAQYPEHVERALADLAQRLHVAAGEITVSSAEPQTWNDASLGLPEPGMMYAQVITEGHVVTLSHAGQTYVYHLAGEAVRLKP